MSDSLSVQYEFEDVAGYSRLAAHLIERASKDQLADVARLLALSIGWYHQRYGDVPAEGAATHGQVGDAGRGGAAATAAWDAELGLRVGGGHGGC